MNTMKITANAKQYEIEKETTVADFIESTGLKASRCVVELNGKSMRFESFAGVVLREGDTLEIMQIVAGG